MVEFQSLGNSERESWELDANTYIVLLIINVKYEQTFISDTKSELTMMLDIVAETFSKMLECFMNFLAICFLDFGPSMIS